MSPDFLPPARCDFSHARKGKWPLSRAFLLQRPFSFSRGKNRISQGVENRGSPISAPLALRVTLWPPQPVGCYTISASPPSTALGPPPPAIESAILRPYLASTRRWDLSTTSAFGAQLRDGGALVSICKNFNCFGGFGDYRNFQTLRSTKLEMSNFDIEMLAWPICRDVPEFLS